jgi:toxin CcdB
MAQFTVYVNLNQNTKDHYPYLVDIQNELLESLDTRLVIPLILGSKYESIPIKELMPVVSISGKKYIVVIPLQAGVNKKLLGPMIADISKHRQEIISAIDFLITGY